MSWTLDYQRKLKSAEEAVRVIRSRDTVYIHPGCATPDTLVRAMLGRSGELEDVEVVHLLTLGCGDYAKPQYEGIFRANALFIGGNVRGAIREGRADYTPVFLHEIEDLFSSGQHPLDVVLLQVSPPDKYGFMSMGIGVDCTLTAVKCARHVIAEVNPFMPRTHGDSFVHVSEVHSLVETNHPLPELHSEPADDVQRRIAAHVAALIPDGATLQMGIGAVPDAVLQCLANHRDLGIHTEMFSDGVVPLIEKGVINGRRKSFHPGKLVAGFVLGTKTVFEFVDDNPLFEFRPIKYVNNPFNIAKNDRMVAINSALQVDLTGQVCADSIGTAPYSGFGGQVDFIRGAAHSEGGVPIIALPSTAKDGTISRISPVLDPGAGVVTTRADVHYIVTEFGAVNLHGKTLRQRAEALISISHPKFHRELEDFARRACYFPPRKEHIDAGRN